MSEALGAVLDALHDEGGLLAATLPPRGDLRDAAAPHGTRVARGPRTAGDAVAYGFVVEAIREGYLLHYAPDEARLVRTADRDLALLAGDRLYALGLERLAALEDLEAVEELADVIALCAAAHADGSRELADAVWEAGVAAVGWGADDGLREAKDRARTAVPSATNALSAEARRITAEGPR